ncbi:hypothetical protein M2323_001954 [Rhodoblastus acidophilus]|nr:hypothetical protein [Rhodoblastus acidophilus]MCW2333032.1 hypothetical protein [Rhodoblastus acidophilus]
MQHERVCVRAKLVDDEWDAMSHQPRNEMHVARQAIQLCDDGALMMKASHCEGSGQLWPALQRVRTFAGFDLHELPDDLQPLGRRKLCDSLALGHMGKMTLMRAAIFVRGF